jgi:hypothetical protein
MGRRAVLMIPRGGVNPQRPMLIKCLLEVVCEAGRLDAMRIVNDKLVLDRDVAFISE